MSRIFGIAVITNLIFFFLYIAASSEVVDSINAKASSGLITFSWNYFFGSIAWSDPRDGIGNIADYAYWLFILSTLVNLYFIYKIAKSKDAELLRDFFIWSIID